MSGNLPTIWPITRHTEAKHAILRRYLEAWFPILTRQSARLEAQFGELKSRRVLYIDGFAGPGVYSGGELGSPLIAIQAANNHASNFPYPVEMLFIEEDPGRHEHLVANVSRQSDYARTRNVECIVPIQGDCDRVLNGLLDDHERRGITFGPALAFLDQFGYGAVSMDLIGRILSFGQCEVFSYLDYKDMNRWITDPNKEATFDRAYGGDEWRECRHLPERGRREKLLQLYESALRTRGKAKYVRSFLMFGENRQPLYWLFFCTNNLRGLEEMKRAMWSVDARGEFRFSDHDLPNQLSLEQSFDPTWLAHELRTQLAGTTSTARDVMEWVLTQTPCYLFRDALVALERDGSMKVTSAPAGRKAGSFPPDQLEEIALKFESAPLF